jgi:ABC-type transport system involved in cytochrome c biogenesis permease subunit
MGNTASRRAGRNPSLKEGIMAISKKRFLVGFLLPVFIIGGLAALFGLMGYYERSRHADRTEEYHDRLAKLEASVVDETTLPKLQKIPMLFAERVQPLDSVARQRVRMLTGRTEIYGVDPTVMFLSMAFDGREVWGDVPLFVVSFGDNRDRFGIESAAKYTTWEKVDSEEIRKYSLKLHEKYGQDTSKMPRSDLEVYNTFLGKLSRLASGFADDFRVVPPTETQRISESTTQNDWHLAADAVSVGHDPAKARALQDAFAELKDSWVARDKARIGRAADSLSAAIVALDPEAVPPAEDLEAELNYNRANPFNRASWLFIISSLVGLFFVAFRKGWIRWTALGFSFAALLLSLWGFYLRTTLGFGVAITNLYESMLAIATASALISLPIDLKLKNTWATIFGGVGSFVLLSLLSNFPEKFDPKIGGLVAVLANNFWIHIHVPIVMSSYFAYLLAFLCSFALLPWTFSDYKGRDPELKIVLRTSEIALYLGTLLIFVGMILGGLWAHDSWGRFWGWDPKETWSFILFTYYLILIHGRYTKWMNAYWYSWFLFTGGNVLLWTYYGTNELLSGLHAYANSAGDTTFWDNFVHERNRWFVYTTITMAALSILSALLFLVLGKRKSGAPPTSMGSGQTNPA